MKKEIIIWGTEVAAIKFMLTHKDVSIKYFIEGKKEIKYFMGNKCLKPQEVDAVPGRDYIVVATSDKVYWEIKNYLEKQGLVEFDDFIYYELFQKKIAIIYGNCHTVPIKQGLKLSKLFNLEYGFYPLHQIQEINNNSLNDLSSNVFERCDLFIHQSIRLENTYGKKYASKELINRLKSNCIEIAIPNLYGLPKFLYPQFDNNLATKKIEGKNYFPFRDKYIEYMWGNGCKEQEIYNYILKGDIIQKNEIASAADAFYEKVKKRETEWNIKIAEWIINKYKETPLFFDPNHPTKVVIEYIINNILCLLNYDEIINYDNICVLDGYEIPLYGDVCNKLELKYTTQNIMRKYTRMTICNNQMDLFEYIKEYILWNCVL